MITFSGFAPDIDPHTESIITDCSNLIPAQKGYKAAPSLVDATKDALAAKCLGAARVVKLDDTGRVFAGTQTHLYENVSGATWTDKSGATYTAGKDDKWRFSQYGDVTLAVNNNDVIQTITTGNFAAITNAPVAAHVLTYKTFVVVADTNDGTAGTAYGDQSDRWWCSALGDYTDWTPAVATQCTTGRLVDTPGPINALKTLGDYIVAYKTTGVYLGRYVGPPVVFAWDNISTDVGTVSSEAVINIGTAHYFIGKDDFYYFDGSRPLPIGNAVKEWFFNDADPSYLYKTIGAHDRDNSCVYWFYAGSSSNGALDSAIVYNYKTQQWGKASYDVEIVMETLLGGITYYALGTYVATYNDFPDISYDSNFFTANAKAIAVFNTSHDMYTLDGTGLNSSLTTAILGNDEDFSLLQRVRPKFVVKPTTGSMINYYANITGDTLTQDATTALSDGKFDVLRSARWHQVKLSFTGDVTIKGITANHVGAGDE